MGRIVGIRQFPKPLLNTFWRALILDKSNYTCFYCGRSVDSVWNESGQRRTISLTCEQRRSKLPAHYMNTDHAAGPIDHGTTIRVPGVLRGRWLPRIVAWASSASEAPMPFISLPPRRWAFRSPPGTSHSVNAPRMSSKSSFPRTSEPSAASG